MKIRKIALAIASLCQKARRERDWGNLLGFGLDDLVRDDAADRTLHGGLFPDERVRLEVSQV
jgi:hypothetical protein